VNGEKVNVWKETIIRYLKVLSRNSNRDAGKPRKSPNIQSITQPKSEPGTYRIKRGAI
jgi:hypothetical protein